MALRHIDSFDAYATADLPERYPVRGGSPTINAGSGRRGTASFRTSSNSAYLSVALDAQATWIMGFAFYYSSLPNTARVLARLLDGASVQADLRLNSDGTLQVTRAGTAVTDGKSTNVLGTGVYAYIEWKITIANSIAENSCKVRVNGADWITVATGQDLQATANAYANIVQFGICVYEAQGFVVDIDDLYICDGTGAANNDFLGDQRVDALLPDEDGDLSQFTPSAGSDQYAVVDDNPPNEDTDYLSSNTVGHISLLKFSSLTALSSPSIAGVQALVNAKKADAGDRGIGATVKSGATTSSGSDQALGTDYEYYTRILETDPDTAVAWTESGVNAIQAGPEVMS
ncbi:MAG: hypothetical protein AB1640_07255 [bacterium]